MGWLDVLTIAVGWYVLLKYTIRAAWAVAGWVMDGWKYEREVEERLERYG